MVDSVRKAFVSIEKGRLRCRQHETEVTLVYCAKCVWHKGRSPGGNGILCSYRTEQNRKDEEREELIKERICPDCGGKLEDDFIQEGRHKGQGRWECHKDQKHPGYRFYAIKGWCNVSIGNSGNCFGIIDREEDGRLMARSKEMVELLLRCRAIIKGYSDFSKIVEDIDALLNECGIDTGGD